MKHLLASLSLLASLAPAAAALPALDDGPEHSPRKAAPFADQVSEALIQLEVMQSLGLPLESSIENLREIVEALPTHQDLRARLARYVEDLNERARQAYITAAELSSLRRQFVAARLDRALAALEERAESGGWSPEELARVASQLIGRAEMFVDAPDPAAYRARVEAAIERAALGAAEAAQMMRSLRIELLLERLEMARQDLLRRIQEGYVDPADYAKLYAAYVASARAAYAEVASR